MTNSHLATLCHAVFCTVRRMIRCNQGSIAVILGLVALVTTLLIAMTIDYVRAIDLRNRLQAAADAAVLSALHLDKPEADLPQLAKDFFLAQLDANEIGHLGSVDSRTEIKDQTVNLILDFRLGMANAILPAFGYETWDMSGSATATYGAPRGLRLHILLDVSDSMGVAATEDARARMRTATTNAGYRTCEFACHTGSELQLARDNNIPLRVDIARAGAIAMIEYATTAYPSNNYSFSLTAISRNSFNVIEATNDKAAILNALAQIDVGHGAGNNDANSWFNISLPQTAAWLDARYNTPEKDIVVLVTDGLQSENHTTEAHLVKPLDTAYCDMLKRNGRKLAVIYTPYVPLAGDHAYDQRVVYIVDDLKSNLESCASPDLFLVSDNEDSTDLVFQQMFHLVNKALYLSK